MKDYFKARKVEMTDNSQLFEIVTPDGERVASAVNEYAIKNLEIDLNCALEDAVAAHSDIVINA